MNRPRPLLEAFRWLVSPIVAWWSFVGTIPALVYLSFGLLTALVVLQFLRLFRRS